MGNQTALVTREKGEVLDLRGRLQCCYQCSQHSTQRVLVTSSQLPGHTPPCNAKVVPCSYLTDHTGGQVEASKSSYQGKAAADC